MAKREVKHSEDLNNKIEDLNKKLASEKKKYKLQMLQIYLFNESQFKKKLINTNEAKVMTHSF